MIVKYQWITILFLLFCFSLSGTEKKNFDKAVRDAVSRQLYLYPKSTLKDLYKNFFQDKFGPGHIIRDTTQAGRYLRWELASYEDCTGEISEPTGWEGNFIRVNLSVIKKGQIPYQIFFEAFVCSVNGINPITIEEWKKEWSEIERVIGSMRLDLPNYEIELKEIEERLERGEYVGHHSLIFEECYSPHYRIISREIFEKELLPLLEM
jgi:hypothetical protein